jgi:hypothetical protein
LYGRSGVLRADTGSICVNVVLNDKVADYHFILLQNINLKTRER